jgi:hypothetical protein
MKIRAILPTFRGDDKDERHAAEEKRFKLLLDLLREMDVPQSRIEFLKLSTQRQHGLKWLKMYLPARNSHHKNFSRARNLIDLLLKNAS